MVTEKRILGITFFLIFTLIFLGILNTGGGEECIVLSKAEAVMIRGGGSSKSSSSPASVNIALSNVPYIYQDIAGYTRSKYYSGIASALMIRSKGRIGGSPNFYSRSQIESYMKRADTDLLNGYYRGIKINLVPNDLLFVNASYSRSFQFEYTKTAVLDLFYRSFTYLPNPYYVSSLSVSVDNYYDTGPKIWNQIKNNRQPVVVIVDVNKLNYYNKGGSYPASSTARTLRYQVIYGIYEQNGQKYVRVHDPLLANQRYNVFLASQYEDILVMSERAPAWVYPYAAVDLGKYKPSYIMLVYGN
jgi:hypothetical protein